MNRLKRETFFFFLLSFFHCALCNVNEPVVVVQTYLIIPVQHSFLSVWLFVFFHLNLVRVPKDQFLKVGVFHEKHDSGFMFFPRFSISGIQPSHTLTESGFWQLNSIRSQAAKVGGKNWILKSGRDLCSCQSGNGTLWSYSPQTWLCCDKETEKIEKIQMLQVVGNCHMSSLGKIYGYCFVMVGFLSEDLLLCSSDCHLIHWSTISHFLRLPLLSNSIRG